MPKKFLSPEETATVRSGKCPRCGGAVLGPPTESRASHQYVACQNKACGGAWRLALDPPRKRTPAPRHLVHFDGYAFGFSSERKYLAWLRACAAYDGLKHPREGGGVQLGEIHHVLDWSGEDFQRELDETLREARERRKGDGA